MRYALTAQPMRYVPSGVVFAALPKADVRPSRPLERIKRKVAEFYHIPLIEMTSARRAREVARPRQIAMYLAKQLTEKSLPAIGREFGNRDHTTVIHAVKQIERLIANDADTAVDVAILREALAA